MLQCTKNQPKQGTAALKRIAKYLHPLKNWKVTEIRHLVPRGRLGAFVTPASLLLEALRARVAMKQAL